MHKLFKLLMLNTCIVFIISTSTLLACAESRNRFVSTIESLSCESLDGHQKNVPLFLSNLPHPAFRQLFKFVTKKTDQLDPELANYLAKNGLITASDGTYVKYTPSETLKQTFIHLKAILDDYNEEIKAELHKSCCGGYLIHWFRENGIKILRFTSTNISVLLTAIVAKSKPVLRSPAFRPLDLTPEVIPLEIDTVLANLVTRTAD